MAANEAIWCQRTLSALVQKWLVARQHQAITQTNVGLSLVRFCGIHLNFAVSVQTIILYNEFETYTFKLLPHLPGASRFMLVAECDLPKCPGIILCMCPAKERWRYNVMPSLIDWAHTQNDPEFLMCVIKLLAPV